MIEEEFNGKGKKSRDDRINLSSSGSGKAKSSINFKPVKTKSETHNTRKQKLEYVYADLSKNNESWIEQSIKDRRADILALSKKTPGRSMRSDATPIREAVVNLNAHHTMADVKKMTNELEKKFRIKTFQIHIHRDEGKSKNELNYHAHIVLDWQNKKTGKVLRLNRVAMQKIQTLTAESLGMERGVKGSTTKRLEAQTFKLTREVEKLERELKNANLELSEKKTLVNLQKEYLLDQSELNFCSEQLMKQPKLKEQLSDIVQKFETQEMKNERLRAPLEQLKHRLKPLQSITKDLEMKLNKLKKILEKKKMLLIKQKKKLTNYLKPNSKSLKLARERRNPRARKMGLGR